MAKPSPTYSGDPALVAIGEAVRALRAGRGLSQEALAVDVGLDRSYVGGIERGEHNLTVMNLLRIANELGVSGSELLKRAGV
jgi:transcriptional regulator with XRE-family HTH domain